MSKLSDNIRKEWIVNDTKRDQGLSQPETVEAVKNISYGNFDHWNLLDLYYPKSFKGKLPVIVSIHGGAYVYGFKEIYQFYLMNLAERGFATVNFNYRLAPEFKFPAALEDTNNVIKWIFENAEKYNLDTDNIFMVGDSAGSHYNALYSCLCTNPSYADLIKVHPYNNFKPKAICLNCGAINAVWKLDENDRGDLFKDLLGDNFKEDSYLLDANLYINQNFPPTFLMTAYYDFLKSQTPVADKILTENHVAHVVKSYGTEEQKEACHVFHVNIKLALAKECNDDECEFLKSYI